MPRSVPHPMPVRHPGRAAHSRFRLTAPLLALLLPAWAAASDHASPASPARPAADDKPTKVASAPATLPEPAAADPMEQLRRRLAERLASGKATEAGGPNDLRVVAKAAPLPPARAGAPAQHGPARKAGDKAGDGHAHLQWGYNGNAGPQTWGGLKPEFALCNSGQRQSPIDIRGGLAVDLDPVRFDYQASRFGVVDNGHTVQVNLAPGNTVEVGAKRFELLQFHFHRPSEERIDGRQFEMSVHLVHKDDQGRLAVVTVLLEKGALPQPALQKVWNNLPLEKNEEAAARTPLDLVDLLPADRRYYTYMGSLTTPPCSEGVQWIVMRQPVAVSPEQIEIFARIYPMNARPMQAAAGRRIMQSN